MKRRITVKTIITTAAAIFLIAVLCFSLYQALIIYLPQMQEKSRYEELRANIETISVPQDEDSPLSPTNDSGETIYGGNDPDEVNYDYSRLAQNNSDLCGWLRISGTEINYPVMKSSEDNPEYYLHRDFDRNYSYSGSLFIGGGCNIDSDVFIIYGHNMNNGSMFGNLDDYKSDAFAAEHSEIILDTLTGRRVYRVFAAFESKVFEEPTDSFVYYDVVGNRSKTEYSEIIQSIKDMSSIQIWNEPTWPQQLLFLSTCSYHTEKGRFVVAAYRVR